MSVASPALLRPLRVFFAVFALAFVTSCERPIASLNALLLMREGPTATFAPSDGSPIVTLEIGNQAALGGECETLGLLSIKAGDRHQRARVLQRRPRGCSTPPSDAYVGYIECNTEICTFWSPDAPGVRADPIFVGGAPSEFAQHAGLPSDTWISHSWPYCVRLRGIMGPEGTYSHLGGNNHQLFILRVTRARNVPDISWCAPGFIDRAPPAPGHTTPTEPFYGAATN